MSTGDVGILQTAPPQPPTTADAASVRRAAPDASRDAPGAGGTVGAPREPKIPRPGRLTIAIMALVAVGGALLILSSWGLWPFASAVVATDDAYVAGRVTTVAPQVGGYVRTVLVRDFEYVKAGQPLIQIDPGVYLQQVDQARGQLDLARANNANSAQTVAADRANLTSVQADTQSARAELGRAALDDRRLEQLVTRGSVSQRERDQASSTYRAGQARVAKSIALERVARERIKSDIVAREALASQVRTAQAQLDLAKLNLGYTVVRAARDGQIGEVTAREGQYLAAGSQIVFFVAPETWVIANFKETQTRFMRIGQPATITVDALGRRQITGRIESFAPATGSQFSLLKPDNASGNFTKIVQRVPIRIRIDPGHPLARRLRPGLSVVAAIDTGSGRRDDCESDDPRRLARCPSNLDSRPRR